MEIKIVVVIEYNLGCTLGDAESYSTITYSSSLAGKQKQGYCCDIKSNRSKKAFLFINIPFPFVSHLIGFGAYYNANVN